MISYWTYWTTGLLDYWTTGLLDYWTTGLLDYWTTGLLDYWTTGLLYLLDTYWTTGLLDTHWTYWTTGLRDYGTTGLLDWISASLTRTIFTFVYLPPEFWTRTQEPFAGSVRTNLATRNPESEKLLYTQLQDPGSTKQTMSQESEYRTQDQQTSMRRIKSIFWIQSTSSVLHSFWLVPCQQKTLKYTIFCLPPFIGNPLFFHCRSFASGGAVKKDMRGRTEVGNGVSRKHGEY
jgi:hypothetical protein